MKVVHGLNDVHSRKVLKRAAGTKKALLALTYELLAENLKTRYSKVAICRIKRQGVPHQEKQVLQT
jgi:hypothetical protein